MPLWLLLVIIGLVVGLLLHYLLGVVLVVIGICLLVFPYLSERRPPR